MKIGIIAPSNSIVGEKNIKEFKDGIKMLEANNFEVIVGKNVYSTTNGYCGSIEEKLEDLYSVCESTKYIMCATGGINSNNLLDKLDYNKIKNNIFIGNSNPVLLFNALYKINSQISYIGPNVKTLGKVSSNFMIESIKNKIINNINDIKTEEPNYIINNGSADGIAIGGNIQSLRRILGTKYFPKIDNSILYLEADPIETNKIEFESIICQFKQANVFKGCNGIIVGNYDDIDFIKSIFVDFKIPVIICKNIGHNVHNNLVPIGKKIKINLDGSIIEINEK